MYYRECDALKTTFQKCKLQKTKKQKTKQKNKNKNKEISSL